MKRIFLDYAAGRGNPNAIYKEGLEAREKLEEARSRIAKVVKAATDEIVFVPWGTEANAVVSAFGGHIVTTEIEHSSILNALKGRKNVTYLKPNKDGLISAKQVEEALQPNTKLVSIMYANNEIGTIQPIKEISRMLRTWNLRFLGTLGSKSIHFHSDCVQAPGLLPIDMQSLGLDMASFSAPKFGGPAGATFLYVRRSTLNSIKGLRDACPAQLALEMAEALEKAEKNREQEVARLTKLRDYFIDKVVTWVPGTQINASREGRLANNANLVLPIDSELVVLELDAAGVAASSGAACSARDCEDGSHVVLALGRSKDEASRSVRFSLGRDTKKSDLDYVVKLLQKIISKHTNIWQTKK